MEKVVAFWNLGFYKSFVEDWAAVVTRVIGFGGTETEVIRNLDATTQNQRNEVN